MAVIGSLAVNVVADTSNFSRGMRKGRRETSLFAKGTDLLKGKLLGLGAVLAAGLVTRFTIRGLREASDEIDRMAKAADRLGVGVTKMQGLHRAAELAGSSASTMDRSLSEMLRNLDKGHGGFRKLNLEIEYLKRLRPETAFLNIADAISRIGDPGERLTAAREIFGRGGEDLIPLMLGGSDAIQQQQAMQNLWSRGDATRVEDANDAMTSLGHTMEDLTQTLAFKAAPLVERFMDRVNNALGGANRDRMNEWTKVFDQMSDPQLARFRSLYEQSGGLFGGRKATARAEAVRHEDFRGFFTDRQAALARGSNPDIEAAFRARDLAIAQRHEELLARSQAEIFKGKTSLGGLDGDPLAHAVVRFVNMGMADAAKQIEREAEGQRQLEGFRELAALGKRALFGLDDPLGFGDMDGEEIDREVRGFETAGSSRGFGALEAGTAEAFAQERRSANQELGVEREQLAELKEHTKQLDEVKEAIKEPMEFEVVNLT